MHRRAMTPMELAAFLLALAMVLACCMGVMVLSVLGT